MLLVEDCSRFSTEPCEWWKVGMRPGYLIFMHWLPMFINICSSTGFPWAYNGDAVKAEMIATGWMEFFYLDGARWARSDVAAIDTQWQTTFTLSVPQNMYHGRAHIGLPGKADNFKPLVLSTLIYIFVFKIHYSISYYTPYLWFPIDKHYHKN